LSKIEAKFDFAMYNFNENIQEIGSDLPAPDLSAKLRETKTDLFAVESKRSLREIISFVN